MSGVPEKLIFDQAVSDFCISRSNVVEPILATKQKTKFTIYIHSNEIHNVVALIVY